MQRCRRRRWGIVCALGLLASLSSCDCEERVREMISNPGHRGSIEFEDDGGGASTTGGPSGPAESEPNDTPEEATSLEIDSNSTSIDGDLADGRDVDWYRLSTPKKARIVELEAVPKADALNLELEIGSDDERGRSQFYDVAGAGESETIPLLRVPTDGVLVALHGAEKTQGSYELNIQKRLARGTIEAEPDDTRSIAVAFPYPGEIQGFYDRPGDRDVYHVPRSKLENGIHSLQVTPTEQFPQTVELYTRRGASEPYLTFEVPPKRRMVLPNLRIDDDFQGLWFELSAGESYAREAGYRLRLLEHPPVDEKRVAIEGEPNDTHERAQPAELDTQVRGYLHRASDIDHFALGVGGATVERTGSPDAGVQAERRDAGSTSGPSPTGDAAGAMPPKRLEPDPTDSPDPTSTRDAGAAPASDREDEAPSGFVARLPDKKKPDHRVRVALKPLRNSDRLTLEWFREGTSQPLRMTSPEKGEPIRICNHPVDEGVLHFAVKGAEVKQQRIRRGFTYALSFRDLAGKGADLELEPNNRRDRADRLELGTQRSGHVSRPDDRDVYAFAVPRETSDSEGTAEGGGASEDDDPLELFDEPDDDSLESDDTPDDNGTSDSESPPSPTSVHLELRGTELDLAFDVLDQEGALIAEVDRRGAGAGEAQTIDLPPGLYYLKVRSKREFSCDPYRIRAEVK